jgi:hypothetical protein
VRFGDDVQVTVEFPTLEYARLCAFVSLGKASAMRARHRGVSPRAEIRPARRVALVLEDAPNRAAAGDCAERGVSGGGAQLRGEFPSG